MDHQIRALDTFVNGIVMHGNFVRSGWPRIVYLYCIPLSNDRMLASLCSLVWSRIQYPQSSLLAKPSSPTSLDTSLKQYFFRVRFVADSEVVLVSKEVNAHNNRLGEVVVTSNISTRCASRYFTRLIASIASAPKLVSATQQYAEKHQYLRTSTPSRSHSHAVSPKVPKIEIFACDYGWPWI
ncbi:predicted protein [Histoplasma capsulatum var. duboisii H88]|uniref:Predicted protein n=1 Tax=Ajellomyces capsulatus (strain H88) TaxID=544711 RepID=F0UQ96_AJEC8|nr:predicted protein [Histoplasma capsulatum var. duboisii H88]